MISDFVEAWNLHDAQALAHLHTEDVNFVNIFGQWCRGRSEVEANLRMAHRAPFAKSTMLLDIEQVRFIAQNVAVVQGRTELIDARAKTLERCHSIRVLV